MPLRQWLRAIEDTLDEAVNETTYADPQILSVFDEIGQDLISPIERTKMFEENTQEELRQTQFEQGLKKGMEQGALNMMLGKGSVEPGQRDTLLFLGKLGGKYSVDFFLAFSLTQATPNCCNKLRLSALRTRAVILPSVIV